MTKTETESLTDALRAAREERAARCDICLVLEALGEEDLEAARMLRAVLDERDPRRRVGYRALRRILQNHGYDVSERSILRHRDEATPR